MKIPVNRERVKLYARIALAYLMLWLFIDLMSTPETFWPRVINNIWLIFFLMINNFILFEFTVPFIRMNWKRLLVGIILIWAHLMMCSFVFYGWRHVGISLNIYSEIKVHPSLMEGVEYMVPYSFFSILFFGVIKYTHDFRKLKEAAQQLRIEKKEAELNYLKSQTNPHFLFNTLNNIYSLARDKSDLAPESILKLSKILRFMLYETSGEYISIEQELKIISDYVALEKLRYDESLNVNFNYDIEDMKQALPPLLLIPLIENAFKHGVSETRSLPFVNIHISVRQRHLELVVKNSTEKVYGDQDVKENIGLSNLRRQLELQYTDYSLTIQQGEAVFTATLKINLASHV